jgi:hypothetical protein
MHVYVVLFEKVSRPVAIPPQSSIQTIGYLEIRLAMHIDAWCRLRKMAERNLSRISFDGLVRACIVVCLLQILSTKEGGGRPYVGQWRVPPGECGDKGCA